jgi:hypothetical protein
MSISQHISMQKSCAYLALPLLENVMELLLHGLGARHDGDSSSAYRKTEQHAQCDQCVTSHVPGVCLQLAANNPA